MTANVDFTFSDTIAGYVTGYDDEADAFGLRTSDGREFRAYMTKNTYSQAMRNFGEAYLDTTGQMRDMLVPERLPVRLRDLLPGRGRGPPVRGEVDHLPEHPRHELIFEQPRWWVNQARFIGDFYLRGQFPDGNYDWRNYRTKLSLSRYPHARLHRRPTSARRPTPSPGWSTAWPPPTCSPARTASSRRPRAAPSTCASTCGPPTTPKGIVYWYHGIDVSGNSQRKMFTSEFGDDYDAIPMYEQIYALAGPTQTYRVTGDPRILSDIEKTITLFDRFYKDPEQGRLLLPPRPGQPRPPRRRRCGRTAPARTGTPSATTPRPT